MSNLLQGFRSALNRLRESLFKGLFRARFRYDVFISYSHSDAKDYAVNLKKQLGNLDFACFIDEEESPPGLSLGPTLEKALKKSAVLVLLATERALTRPYIAMEFETFFPTKRTIIPINIAGALTNNNEQALSRGPWNLISERKLIWIDETPEAFTKQNPSPPIADGIDKLFKYTRRNVRVRTEIIGTAALVLLAAFGAGFVIKGQAAEVSKQATLAENARQETQKQQAIALEAGTEAQRQLSLARQAKDEAERQGQIADTAKKEAERQQEIARTASAEAEKQQLLARKATLEAQRQQAIAEQQLERSRHLLYDSDINLAQRAQESHDLARLTNTLNIHLPIVPAGNKSDVRGFEWFYYWRLASHKPFSLGPVDYVGDIAVSPDGKLLAAVSQSNNIKLWSLQKREALGELSGHKDRITGLAFAWNGTWLATASADNSVRVWDMRTMSLLKTLRTNPLTGFLDVDFSRDGKMLATVGFNRSIKLWDTSTWLPFKTIDVPQSGEHSPVIPNISFSPDGNTLATYDNKTVRLIDVQPPYEEEKQILTGENIGCIQFSPNGKKLIAGVEGNKLRVMDWPDWLSVRFLEVPRSSSCPFTISQDGNTLATLSVSDSDPTAPQGNVHLWDVQSASSLGTFNVEGWLYSFALYPDGRTLAIRDSNSVKLWDLRGVEQHVTLNTTDWVQRVTFSPSGKLFATQNGDHFVTLWDSRTLQELPGLKAEPLKVSALTFSPDGSLATGHEDGSMKLWNVERREETVSLKVCESGVTSLSISRDGHRLAVGCSNGTIALWDPQTTQELAILAGHSGLVLLAISPNGKLVASVGNDKNVLLWDATTGKKLRVLEGHHDIVDAVEFSSDSNMLASASKDKTVKLWEVSSGKERATLKGHFLEVTSLAFSPDSKTLASGSEDKSVKLWDTYTGQEVLTFRGHSSTVSSVAFSPDGGTLASGSHDRTVKLWFAASEADVKSARKNQRETQP
jgi:WD40 repeat protein